MLTAILHATSLVLALTSSICLANDNATPSSNLTEDTSNSTIPAVAVNVDESRQSPPAQMPNVTSTVPNEPNTTTNGGSGTGTTVGRTTEDHNTTSVVNSLGSNLTVPAAPSGSNSGVVMSKCKMLMLAALTSCVVFNF